VSRVPGSDFDAVWINGSVGAGKTTTADRLAHELGTRGVPGAVIDVDELRRAWPAPAEDRFQDALALSNVAAVAANFRARGARVIVAAGVIEEVDSLPRWASALRAKRMLHVVLAVDPAVAARRLRERHAGDAAGSAWHLHRHPELAAVLARARFDGALVLDTTALSPAEVACRIADAL